MRTSSGPTFSALHVEQSCWLRPITDCEHFNSLFRHSSDLCYRRSGACFAKTAAAPDRLATAATAGPSRAFRPVTGQAAAAAPAAQLQGLHSPDAENALILNEVPAGYHP